MGKAMQRGLLACALVGCLAALATGCVGRKLVIRGYPVADVFVENPPASKKYTYIGRTKGTNTCTLTYPLPKVLKNANVTVRLLTSAGAYNYVVYTDRDTEVNYPPEGFKFSVKKKGVKPVKPQPQPAPTDDEPVTAPAKVDPDVPSASVINE
jgi:hypothetical protein